MKKSAQTVEVAPVTPQVTRIIRAAIPYNDEMILALESRLDDLAACGFEVVTCVPYGVDHMVILLKRTAA